MTQHQDPTEPTSGPISELLLPVRDYLRDKGAGQEAHQANGSAAHGGDPAAQNVCEDTDDGRAEEDHPYGE